MYMSGHPQKTLGDSCYYYVYLTREGTAAWQHEPFACHGLTKRWSLGLNP